MAACGDSSSSSPTASSASSGSTSSAAEMRQLAFQAAWINDAEFIGYFIGIDNGYYSDEGLEIDYLSGGPDVIPESSLLSGRAPIALTTPDTTIKAISEDGAKLKIIGTQFQKNPIGVVSLVESGINSPQDLVGKTLAVPPVNTLSVEAMFRLNDIDPADVNIVPYQFDPTPLIKREIDASLDFTVNVPFSIREAGEEATSFLLYDYGFTTYNDTVVVTEEALNERRDDLVKFLRASRRGWNENFQDLDKYPAMFGSTWFSGTGRSVANETFYNNAAKDLIDHPNGVYTMTEEDIAANLEALASIGINGDRDMFDTTLLEEI
ncbi:MAG TPA: myristoyl transferase [Acidimicrobiales bacterium]|nr:myristoyl transferase [Acidimicrobiales bacterium]